MLPAKFHWICIIDTGEDNSFSKLSFPAAILAGREQFIIVHANFCLLYAWSSHKIHCWSTQWLQRTSYLKMCLQYVKGNFHKVSVPSLEAYLIQLAQFSQTLVGRWVKYAACKISAKLLHLFWRSFKTKTELSFWCPSESILANFCLIIKIF